MRQILFRIVFSYSLVIFFVCISCTNSEPSFPIVPSIEFVSILPSKIKEGEPFTITVKYKDGDGDLGFKERSASDTLLDFMVIDTRPNMPPNIRRDYSSGFLPYLTPETKNPSIQGEISMKLEGISIVNQVFDQEDVVFQIYLYDRKRHESNKILTTPLTIER